MSLTHPSFNNWTPGPNFEPVKSELDGILVYAPRPKSEENSAPKTFSCPQCGAVTRFDVTAGGVACEHCGYTRAADAPIVGKKAAVNEFTIDTWNQALQGWGVERRVLHCDSCGAELSVTEDAITATCSFCASNKVNIHAAASETLRPRFLIPFKIQPKTNQQRAREWLGKGWYHPAELNGNAIIANFRGMYLPFWTFSAHMTSDWRAEVGYERQERYYDHSAKEWRTRTEIDWRWESGRVQVPVENLLISGSSHVSHRILEQLYPFNLQELAIYTPDFLAGWQAHAYDIPLTTAWEQGKESMRETARQACRKDIHSSHVRNFSMTADFGEESWRYILLPVYLATYQYENKTFQVMVNGQTGTVAGQKPVAWWKVWLAIAAMLAPGILTGLIGLPLLLAGGVGIFVLILALIFLLVGGGFAIGLYRQAVASEAA